MHSASRSPTSARYWVIVFAITLAVLSYGDRIVIAQAAPEMRRDLGLTAIQWGWVLGVFSWAYALCEIPGGWMGDHWGPKKVLLRVVALWSLFTTATGWTRSYGSLLACRTLFGIGEAGCFPNLTKAFTLWLPLHERVKAQGWMWFAARWGGAITPFLVAVMLTWWSWRRVFEFCGVLGFIWAVLFFRWFRDNPRDHPAVNAAERDIVPPAPAAHHAVAVPWKWILTSPSVWLLWLQYFFLSYGWWFYIQWLPTYLKEARGFAVNKQEILGAILAGLPLFLGGIGCWISGQLSPWLERVFGNVGRARRYVGVISLILSGGCIALSVQIPHAVWAMTILGFAGFLNDLTIPCSWGACMDIGGRYAGTISGGMNTFGAAGGAVAGPMVGYLLTWSANNWNVPLYVAAAAYLLAACCWIRLDSEPDHFVEKAIDEHAVVAQ